MIEMGTPHSSLQADTNASHMTQSVSKPTMIRLDDFLKHQGIVGTGGEAKMRIQSGEVQVNGEVETRRRKQLLVGDVIEVLGQTLRVE